METPSANELRCFLRCSQIPTVRGMQMPSSVQRNLYRQQLGCVVADPSERKRMQKASLKSRNILRNLTRTVLFCPCMLTRLDSVWPETKQALATNSLACAKQTLEMLSTFQTVGRPKHFFRSLHTSEADMQRLKSWKSMELHTITCKTQELF